MRKNLKVSIYFFCLGLFFLESCSSSTSNTQNLAPKIGNIAPNIILNNADDKPIELKQLRGKYVLIDFWASWCAPCRQENPHLVKAYQQFKNQNFTIFSVSLDHKKEPWLSAIKEDKLSWEYHISDLKGWENAAAELYQVASIPQNFLIDPKGNIIAKNLSGKQLIEKLSEIMVNTKP